MSMVPQLSVSESEYRNFSGTNSQELRYPFAGTTVQFWQESSGWLTEVSDYISDEEITDSVVPSAITTYEYDDAGNRISRDTEGEVTTSQYNQHESSETVDSSEDVTSNVSYSHF